LEDSRTGAAAQKPDRITEELSTLSDTAPWTARRQAELLQSMVSKLGRTWLNAT
jgi:hypothetical protein